MLSAEDVRYIAASFRTLDELCAETGRDPTDVRSAIEAGTLPRPTYVLDDGTEMVPPDYFELLDSAGELERVRDEFERRFRAAGGSAEELEEEWRGYLSGEYGACLREVTPENIVRKDRLMRTIERLLESTAPDDEHWRESLRSSVDQLDSLEREFARYDRERFGGPVSRDRLITAPRERFPEVFADAAT